MHDLEKKVEVVQIEKLDLQQKFKFREKKLKNETIFFKGKFTETSRELEELKKRLGAAEKAGKSEKEYEERIRELEKLNRVLTTDLSDLRQELAMLRLSNSVLKTQITELRIKIDSSFDQTEELKVSFSELSDSDRKRS